MKKVIYTIIFFIVALSVAMGQGDPGDLPSSISGSGQTVSPTSTKNYILKYTYLDEFTSHPGSLDIGDASTEIQYFDGLGRQVQTVSVNATQLGKDLLTYQTYDVYSRADKSYLPYAKNANYGAYVGGTTYTTAQSSFLTSLYGATDGPNGYSQPEYESSPLNRILKQGSPGDDWQLDQNPVEFEYTTNASQVNSWKYTGASYTSANYAAGTLHVTETTDEDGKVVTKYSDFDGKPVQTIAGGAVTRYCYDEFGLLRCVLQPPASTPSSSDFCFYYKYDSRKRLTDKYIPGRGWIYYIYDSYDRLVLAQDANQRAKSPDEWSYIIYDSQNRPFEQGVWATSTSRSTLITSMASSLNYMQGQGTRVPQKYLHYDNYSGAYSIGADASTLGVTQASDNTGRLTWEETKLLESEAGMDTWIKATYFYDKYNRIIQAVTDNHLNNVDYITSKYNFTGQVIQERYRHTTDGTTTYTDQYNDYNHRGNLIKIRYKINGGSELLLLGNSYDEAGNLVDKYLHSESGGNFLQRNDYVYNIRGWLTQIDDPTSFSENDKFGLELNYNVAPYGGNSLLNGNISGMKWGTPNYSNMLYRFSYDNKNQLTGANFYKSGYSSYAFDCNYEYYSGGRIDNLSRRNSNGTEIDGLYYDYDGNRIDYIEDTQGDYANIVDYPGDEQYIPFEYDSNGNMNYEPAKDVSFDYNQLNLPIEVDFGANRKINYFYSFDGQKFRQTVEDNGTITKTDYCGSFVYETVSGTRSLKYIVTPEGRAVKDGANWDFEYNLKDHLGNVRVVIHKGGNGLAEVIQERHYYPFGMEMSELSSGSSTNKYLYNGKEHQNDFDLDWYDYGARFYDPELGRWHSVDPLAEMYNSNSPYTYVLNNPVGAFDPNGMYSLYFNGEEVTGDLKNYIQGQMGLPDDSQQGKEKDNNDDEKDKKSEDKKDSRKPTIQDGTELGNKNLSWWKKPSSTKIPPPTDEEIDELFATYWFVFLLADLIDPSPSEYVKIGKYREMRKLTKGHRGAIHAHHLIEVRHLKRLGLSTLDAPAIVLSRLEHVAISNKIYQLLPTGGGYSVDEIQTAYKQVYKNPEVLKAIETYFGKIK